jgi:hypothetical protein
MTNGHHNPIESEPFIAGEIVEPGLYQRLGTNIQITLSEVGHLPGSLDGKVASYERVCNLWHQHSLKHK